MIGTFVYGHTFTAIIGVICVFLSVILAIYSIRNAINQGNEVQFKNMAFFSAALAAIAYFISLLVSWLLIMRVHIINGEKLLVVYLIGTAEGLDSSSYYSFKLLAK